MDKHLFLIATWANIIRCDDTPKQVNSKTLFPSKQYKKWKLHCILKTKRCGLVPFFTKKKTATFIVNWIILLWHSNRWHRMEMELLQIDVPSVAIWVLVNWDRPHKSGKSELWDAFTDTFMSIQINRIIRANKFKVLSPLWSLLLQLSQLSISGRRWMCGYFSAIHKMRRTREAPLCYVK